MCFSMFYKLGTSVSDYEDHGGTTTMHMHACMLCFALLIVCDCGLNVEVKELVKR